MQVMIPARGGSKGIHRKNLVLLNGKPLLQHTIEAAQQSRAVGRILLTTDDAEILELGASLGLDVSYTRPVELAEDDTPMSVTLAHSLEWLEKKYGVLEEFMVLQPTSPLRTASDIDNAIEMYSKSQKNSLISVNITGEHPYECVVLQDGGWKYLAENTIGATRRQEYPNNFFYINGAIYITKVNSFKASGKIMDEDSVCFFPMQREHSIDIDNLYDLMIAEAIISGQS